MAVAAIDTHEVVKELHAAGFTEGQAEAVSRVVRQAQNFDLSDLATKGDLATTRAGLETSIAETRATLEKSIAETKVGLERSLAETKAALETSIAETRAEIRTAIAETKAEILKWMVSTLGLQTVVIIGAVISLVRPLH